MEEHIRGSDAEVQEDGVSEGNTITLPKPPTLPPNLVVATTQRNHKTSENFSPIQLHFAINKEDVEEVQSILTRSGSRELNFMVRGNTPLIAAIWRENREILTLLIEALAPNDLLIPENARWKRQPIHIAIRTGQLQAVQRIVSKCPQSIHSTDALLFTPLHWAAIYNRLEIASLLIDAGAHINVRDDQARTPLHRAVQYDSTNMVKLLLREGATTEIRDQFGWTPIFHSITCGMLDTLQCLLEHGASVQAQDLNAQTPLHYAACRTAQGHLDIVSRCSTDYNLRHLHTAGPAMHSALYKHPSVDLAQVRALLSCGACVNALDVSNKTAFRIAISAGHFKIAKLLYAAGVDLLLEATWLSTHDWSEVVLNDESFCEWLAEKFEAKVRTLSDLCKFAIRKCLKRDINSRIQELQLPSCLQRYCALEDVNL